MLGWVVRSRRLLPPAVARGGGVLLPAAAVTTAAATAPATTGGVAALLPLLLLVDGAELLPRGLLLGVLLGRDVAARADATGASVGSRPL
jgi:hypothetical protein